jgi:hypothetical protein
LSSVFELPVGEAYQALGELRVGPAALRLDLTLARWAADGLLAIFFVAGAGDHSPRLEPPRQSPPMSRRR